MKESLENKIATALAEVTSAQSALAEVLREIRGERRAEKTWTISKAVEDAFARLKVAKTHLLDLERLANQKGD
jgi:hypothetical protein